MITNICAKFTSIENYKIYLLKFGNILNQVYEVKGLLLTSVVKKFIYEAQTSCVQRIKDQTQRRLFEELSSDKGE